MPHASRDTRNRENRRLAWTWSAPWARPVIEKYTGVLGAVDVFTTATAFTILESIRLDLGYRMDVHP
jgi:hypothetical protein